MPSRPKHENPLDGANKTQKSRKSVPANGERIARLRREFGWNQERLAGEARCNLKTIQNAEAGGNIFLTTLVKIATALEVKPKNLIVGSSQSTNTAVVARTPVLVPQGRNDTPFWTDLQVRQMWTFDEADCAIDGDSAVQEAFHKLWAVESTRGWKSSITRGAYWLENEHAKRDDRRWIDFSPEDGHLSFAPVSVEVFIEQERTSFGSGAGLLYRFQGGRTRYYSFLLTGDGQARFAIRRRDGEHELYKSSSDALREGRFNKLSIASRGDQLFLFVNETLLKTVRNDELRSGGLGIVASGTGRFAFRNLIIYADPD